MKGAASGNVRYREILTLASMLMGKINTSPR